MSILIAKTFAALALAVAGLVLATAATEAETEAPEATEATKAQALNAFSYIASFGSDANKCTLAAPCRTLQKGISRTRFRGVLQISDSGHYGPGTITQSINIQAIPGTATVGAIVINGSAVVALRGLLVNGATTAANTPGISIMEGTVHIEDCTVERFSGSSGHGIVSSSGGLVLVSDSIVRHNSGNAIWLGAPGNLTVKSTTALNNRSGYVVSGNGTMTLESVVATKNLIGVNVAGGFARISNSLVTDNANFGLRNDSGTLASRGNNTVNGNGLDTLGAITPFGGV